MMPRSCAASSAWRFSRNLKSFVQRYRAGSDPVCESGSFDQLHHQCMNAAGIFKTINCADVRVIQRGENLGFAPEARHSFRVRGEWQAKL
jgi:hypothetical protein